MAMATTVASLVERVRDLVDDYGDTTTTLVSSAAEADTSLYVSSLSGISDGAYLNVDYEVCRVAETITGPPDTVTVQRGQRGSVAAAHESGTLVIVNALYPSHRILLALNIALSKLTKQVRDTATLTVEEDQYIYEVPSTIRTVYRIEIEDPNEDDQYVWTRNWEMVDDSHFRLYGYFPTDRGICVVGVAPFNPMQAGGELDPDFPDDNTNAVNYLLYEAVGQLLLGRQAKIAGRDSYEGLTDPFASYQPDHSAKIAMQFMSLAERARRKAIAQCPILQTPVAPTQSPTRGYLARW